MSRNRKGLRKLSQTGLHRIPRNPNQRVAKEGGGKPAGMVLDAFNERQERRWLHPTKGWRRLNEKRTAAALIVSQILHHEPRQRKGSTPNKYMPHIGAKQREKASVGGPYSA
jgi:hypothetical protein